MTTWMYAGTAQRRTRERRLAQRRRRNVLTPPAFRLLSRGEVTQAGGGVLNSELASGDPQIQPVDPRPLQLLLARETACSYLEQRPKSRRCTASDGREVSLDYQVSYCLRPKHSHCGFYRQARGLRSISPQRLAVYTVLILVMAGLILVAGIQAATSGSESAAVQPGGQGMVEE